MEVAHKKSQIFSQFDQSWNLGVGVWVECINLLGVSLLFNYLLAARSDPSRPRLYLEKTAFYHKIEEFGGHCILGSVGSNPVKSLIFLNFVVFLKMFIFVLKNNFSILEEILN